jgi:hypothetical protein
MVWIPFKFFVLPACGGGYRRGGERQAECRPISDQNDLIHVDIVFVALPLLYPPPYDGGGLEGG